MRIVALAGGVGGAKLVSGLAGVVSPASLTVIVNTGDDFDWMGLRVCPDLDTVVYTLASLADPTTGWGLRGDSFRTLDRLKILGCDPWFAVGDLDLATHILRTHLLKEGVPLSRITEKLCRKCGVSAMILPMADSPVSTIVHSNEGDLPFQDYFVRRKCRPAVTGFSFAGAEQATPAPGVLEALNAADAIILCPSNPFISIGPILAVPGVRPAIRNSRGKVIAVSPIIAGRAIKGPAAAMLEQLGMSVSAHAVAEIYRDLLDLFILDETDRDLAASVSSLGMAVRVAPILMTDDAARVNLAKTILESAQ